MSNKIVKGVGYVPALAGESRIFLIENRAHPTRTPEYYFTAKMLGATKDYGETTPVKIPDPHRRNRFISVRKFKGEEGNLTTQIMSRYAREIQSRFLQLAERGCSLDVQLHFGECKDPAIETAWQKIVVLEEVDITSWATDNFGAIEEADQAPIGETTSIMSLNVYELVRMVYSLKGAAVVTNEVVDMVICDEVSCGDCGDPSAGYNILFGVTLAAGGSPSTPADVIFSEDGGKNWIAHDVDTLGAAEDPTGLACLGDYIVVISNASNSLHYALKSDFSDGIDPEFAEVTTGFVAGGEPNAIYSDGRQAFIVGDGGYIYKLVTPSDGVTVLDAGEATTSQLNDVCALGENFAVAVGNDGSVVYTEDGETWAATEAKPVNIGTHLNTVLVQDDNLWFVGTSAGTIFASYNKGKSWSAIALPGTTPTSIQDIKSPTDSEIFVSAVVSSHARIYRSTNGGKTFQVEPDSGTLPLADRINALAVTSYEPNFLCGGGLADDGADGAILLGLPVQS